MGITVNTNIAAIGAYNNLNKTSDAFTASLARLSSGMKINTAADDAAGYVISQQLQRQSNSYGVAINNAQDGVSVLQTAQGALNQTTSILQRMNELAMRAANGSSSDTSAAVADNQEFTTLKSQMDQIANSTVFGGASLLNGSYNATFQVGTDASSNSTVNVNVTNGLPLTATGASVTGTPLAAASTVAIAAGDTLTFKVDGSATNTTATMAAAVGTGATPGTLATALQTAMNAATSAGKYTVAADATGALKITDTATGSAHSLQITGGTGGSLAALGLSAGSVTTGISAASGTGFDSAALGLSTTNIATQATASASLATIKTALDTVTQAQSTMGAAQNRLTVIATNLGVGQQNLQAANSRLVDTDMAQEMTTFSSLQILKQVGTSMLAQAQQAPQTILKLVQ